MSTQIIGYRKLSEEQIALMNEGKALANQVEVFINKLRAMPATPAVPHHHTSPDKEKLTIDQRWVSIGVTDLQKGFMCVLRGITQPDSF